MNGTALVKYHNHRMLFTLDLSMLISVVLEECGPSATIQFEEMTEPERADTVEATDGLEAVTERFRLFVRVSGDWVRREDLEKSIVERGQK